MARPGAIVLGGLDATPATRRCRLRRPRRDAPARIVAGLRRRAKPADLTSTGRAAHVWSRGRAYALHRVLLASLGVERDRLPRPGLSARLPATWASTPANARGTERHARTFDARPGPRDERCDLRRARQRDTRDADRNDSRGCCSTTGPAPTTGCAPTCAATPTTTRSTWWSSAPAPAAARWPSGWPAPAGAWCCLDAGPFWDPDTRLGQRRTRLPQPVLDRTARRSAASDPVPLGSNNSGPRRRRLDDPLRRLHPALSPLRLHTLTPRRRRRGLAHRLRRPASRYYEQHRSANCRSPGRTGRGATRTATRTPRTR